MKRKSWIIGGLVVMVLLAGAAFVAGRMLNQPELSGGLVPGSQAEGGKAPRVRRELIRASELPASEPDAIGPFVERRDNSLLVAFGSKFQVLTNKDGAVSTKGQDSGQRLEVVVTTATALYEDITDQPSTDGASPPAGGKVQQKVAAGALDGIGTNSMVMVWGERNGDRLTAKVVVYTPAEIILVPDHPDDQ
jgi:hypothetical protein